MQNVLFIPFEETKNIPDCQGTWLAQSGQHASLNLRVVSWSPTMGLLRGVENKTLGRGEKKRIYLIDNAMSKQSNPSQKCRSSPNQPFTFFFLGFPIENSDQELSVISLCLPQEISAL